MQATTEKIVKKLKVKVIERQKLLSNLRKCTKIKPKATHAAEKYEKFMQRSLNRTAK